MNNPLAGTDPTGYRYMEVIHFKPGPEHFKPPSLGSMDRPGSAAQRFSLGGNTNSHLVEVAAGATKSSVNGADSTTAQADKATSTTDIGSPANTNDNVSTTSNNQNKGGANDPGVPIAVEATRAERILDAIDPTLSAATGKDTGINAENIRSYSISANPGSALTAAEKAQVAAVFAKGGVKAAEALLRHLISRKLSNVRGPAGVGGNGAASEIQNLSGLSANQVQSILQHAGFKGKTISESGYQKFKHADRSEVWVNWETGRVVRNAAPKYGSDGSRINKGQRLGPDGSEIPRNIPHDKHPEEFFSP